MGVRTVGEAMSWAASLLRTEGLGYKQSLGELSTGEQAYVIRREIEQLLLRATGWSRARLLVSSSDSLPADADRQFKEGVRRRAKGEPLQYILGVAGFFGYDLAVRRGCLIPRPETEILVELAANWINAHCLGARVCDVGTGSGAIAIALALTCPQAQVTAVDISVDALAIARENAQSLGAPVDFVHADGVVWLQEHADNQRAQCPHVLVSNPPYIPSAEIPTLDTEVQDWEPRLALDGGADGLDIYRAYSRLGAQAFAQGEAALFLEVGAGQAEAVLALFAGQQVDWPGWTFTKAQDLRGIDRIVMGQRA